MATVMIDECTVKVCDFCGAFLVGSEQRGDVCNDCLSFPPEQSDDWWDQTRPDDIWSRS